jgi:hypothetical protein
MDEDFPGRFLVEGFLYAGSRNFHSAPVQLRADFEDDGDWLSISADAPYLDYHFIVYLPEEDLESISGNYQWAIFDEDQNELDSGEQTFRVPFSTPQFENARYVRITADAKTEIDPVTNETVVTPAYYRVGIGQQGDAVGNTIETARPYQNNWRGYLGSSILDSEDVDFFSVELEAGTDYEFSLFGNLFDEAQLPDATFELHDENGIVVDSSAVSTFQRDLQFQPTEDKTYYLKVTSNELNFLRNGSYFIRSNVFDDDFLADSQITRGRVNPGETFTNSVDYEGDIDWARLNRKRFHDYRIETPLTEELKIVDRFGSLAPLGRFGELETVLFATQEPRYVEFSGADAAEFRFDEYDADEDFILANATPEGPEFDGAIETAGDVDLFEVRLVPFVDYEISVVESLQDVWSDDLVIEMLNRDGSVTKTFNVTSEENSFTFNASDGAPAGISFSLLRRDQILSVRANNETTTGYQLTFTPQSVDSVPNTLGTSELLTLRGGVARERNVLEGTEDWDVYRVEVQANKWYELDGLPSPSGISGLFRATDTGSERVSGAFNNNKENFYFREPGTYYVAFGATSGGVSDGFAGFEFTFSEDATPDPAIRQWYPNGYNTGFHSRFGFRDLPTEVWSDVPFESATADDQPLMSYAAGQLHNLTPFEWDLIGVSPNVPSPGTIYYRNVAADGRPMPWEAYEIIDDKPIPELDPANINILAGFNTFHFTEELPEYLADDPRFNTSFETVSDSQKPQVMTALNRWRNVGNQFSPSETPNSNAQMQIFVADLGDDVDVMSFAPGDDLGRDLVINSRSSLLDGSDTSDESIFRLLRAIGVSMGLPLVESVDRFTSVMGTRPVTNNEDVWPAWPMPADLRLVRGNENYNLSNETVFQFPESGSYLASVMSRPLQQTVISAEGLELNASINLGPGQSSSVLGSPDLQVIHMAPGTAGYQAIGGEGNDGLTGNHRANILVGNGGNDVLIGGSGNDLLQGGAGNDYYIFRTASGMDNIDESADGGTDVVRFEGMYDYDSIAEDFTFRRFGNDLLIRLELNDQRNNNGDQIRIRNMGDESSRIEAMALLNTDGFVNRISLQSIWDQATESRLRYQVVAGNDGFGSLVAPV